jgi:predicted ATPase/transcriptional regulator with XRE-family HTH domain
MEEEVSFGHWMKVRRKALDFTCGELAEKIGYSTSALRKIESDERRPSKQLSEVLIDILKVPEEERPLFMKVARGERSIEQLKSLPPLPTFSLLPSSQPGANSIPVPLMPLVGREAELSALHQMLRDPQCRLITLVGPGGIGKTRLAIEVARTQNTEYDGEIVFVSLAPINSVSLLVPAIADALGFKMQGSSDPGKQLLDYLFEKKWIFVLDNFEHLLEGVGLLVEMLKFSTEIKILCTSRERLNVQGEWVFYVRGLNDPEAVDLFASCAHRIEADFCVNVDNRFEIEQICHLVEGLPLAIELAATWVCLLPLSEIAQEIQRNLDFLSTGRRDLPERQRSMRAVFDHSWEMLTEGEQRVLSRLSVFRGSFTREAAEQVAGASLGTLSSLLSRSLVLRTEAGRYHVHELLRQFAAGRLQMDGGEPISAPERHYAYYLAQAEAAKQDLKGPSDCQSECLGWLEREHDNLRAALAWSLDQHDGSALQLACALRWFWYVHGHFHEGRDWLVKALQPAVDLRLRARALEGVALLLNAVGDHRTARCKAEESAALFRRLNDRRGLADALLLIGHAMLWQGEAAEAQALLNEALALYREAGDRLGVARTLSRLGSFLADWGGKRLGIEMLEESLAILQELGDTYFIGNTLVSLGIVCMGAGEFASALTYFEEALNVARETGHVWDIADALTNLGCLARILGDYESGRTYLEEALHIYKEQGFSIWRADPLCSLAEIEILQGNLSLARYRLEEASALVEKSENRWLRTLVSYFHGLLAYYEGDTAHAVLFLQESATIARESQYMPDLARSLDVLGRVLRAQGDPNQAAALLRESFILYERMGQKSGIATSLERLAGLASEKDAVDAANLFGSAEAMRERIGAPLPPVDYPLYEKDFARVRAQLGDRAFARAWANGKSLTMDQVRERAERVLRSRT